MLQKIYIIHYTKLLDRKRYVDDKLKQFDLEKITEYACLFDRNNLKSEDIEKYSYSKNCECYFNREKVMDIPYFHDLNNTAISITLEHLKCYENFLKTEYDQLLVLEDDVIFLTNNFNEEINDYIDQIESLYKNNSYILYVGQGANRSGSVNENNLNMFEKISNNIYIHNGKISHYSDSYVINRKACEIILEKSVPFYFAIDWELNYIHKSTNVLPLYSYPQLTIQGSDTIYRTSNENK